MAKLFLIIKNKNQLIFDSTKSQNQYYYVFLKYEINGFCIRLPIKSIFIFDSVNKK
jgi:hypothetical protein